MKLKKYFSIFLINTFIFLFLISIVEIISRKLEAKNTEEQKLLDLKRSIAYEGIKDQFDLLSDDCNRNYFMVSNGEEIEFADKNFDCPGVTVRNGKRVTVGSNSRLSKKVHIFGGSTVFGTGSTDAFTIPSLIQKKLNQKGLDNVSVINHGFASLVSKQQLSKLKKTNINENDVVVFYDGGNDAFLSYIYENMDGTIVGFNRENKISFLFSRIRFYLSKESSFYRLLSKIKKGKSNEYAYCGPEFNESKSNKYIKNYFKNLTQANRYTDSKNIRFIHFFQPILGSGGQLEVNNYYPKVLLSAGNFEENPNFDKCLIENINQYYRIKANAYDNFKNSFSKNNLTQIFNGKNIPESHFYIDNIHITPKGSEIIAEEMTKQILTKIKF